MTVQPADIQRSCRRCGICCSKGGPALHSEDLEKVVSGKIPLKSLFTIREGEPAYDNILGKVSPAASDIIKIKSAADNDSTCLYLDTDRLCCTIYEHRSLECRLMACWDTRPIIEVYQEDRLTREHILTRFAGLSDLITEHQQRCNYQRVSQWADIIKKGNPPTEIIENLLALIRYDLSLRKVTVERTHLDTEMLDFLFGRPLSVTIRLFHLKLVEQGESFTIVAYI